MKRHPQALAAAAVLLLAACVQMPAGPTVSVMPAPYKPFELFRTDDAACRGYADTQVRGPALQAQDQAAAGVATGAAVGAVAGGLITDSARGAGSGAAIGLIAGSLGGAASADRSSWSLQRRYNIAYEQCMYAKGNQVPGFAPVTVPPPPPPPSVPPQPR
ncbi:MAG: hypothetical protein WC809_19185 [Sinimarinibacterium sp.]|jgi:uncharacterized protein YcfJ